MIRRLFNRRHPSIKLNVLIYQEGNEWIAHCLQMDLVAASKSEREAEKDVIDLIKAQVIYAIENDNLGYIFRQAPAEEWAKLAMARRCGTRRIRIDVPEKTASRHLPAVNEVELCVA
jgi:hypothetical protein